MQIKIKVQSENIRPYNGKEYVTATGMEDDATPISQLLDYQLREDEMLHKGKLVGKVIRVQVTECPQIFHGRLRIDGKILEVAVAK